MEIGTKTKKDALERMSDASTGSLAGNPSIDYLVTLRQQIWLWLGQINEAIIQAEQIEFQQTADMNDLGEGEG